ncbi:DNA-directed DNA polymerase [Methanocaldococcus infernus ME]|uniref:DNA polymerase II small subunit n=1 Tax=Methanocaldococcus infernus (strain DSM 11812 / JCM 15783 / ME) TaxID=573063 RepID=D5VRC8_METIM|nr:DNA-directed DNA polymerase II small subunit [Methanocaldococcus infernus]ADG13131.1 DNA-directed DNA polymerase [Methanocaldococcus infernus ME]
MINKFLEIEVLLSPEVYEELKKLSEERIEELIEKIREFKFYNRDFILLDKKFFEIFLYESLEDIIKKYKNFDFIYYYTGVTLETEEKPIKEEETKVEEKEEIKEETKEETIEEVKEEIKEEHIKELERVEKIRESFKGKIEFIAKDIETRISIYEDTDVSNKSTCEGKIDDFIRYFRDRFERLKKFIERRAGRKALPISKLENYKGEEVFTVGMVYDVRDRGDKVIVEIEDEEERVLAVIDKELYKKSGEILLDEVIGFIGKFNRYLYVKDIIRPSINKPYINKTKEELYMAFLSDIHVGSNEFLYKDFEKFIEFLNGNVKNSLEEKIVSRLKYICIAGDLVDGIGVYPGQEEDLYEIDIMKQYEEVAKYIEQIPEHIAIVISPGNHDAVRPAEPQPRLPKEIIKLFNRENIYFVGNPCTLNIHGLDTLLYHGRSFDDLVSQIPTASYENPFTIMKEVIKRRHLSPVYGGRCPITPEEKDYLVIERDIDILHTGHIHINGYGIYRNVALINSGTFQEQTDFQKRMGIKPTPSIVPILRLDRLGESNHYIEWDRGIVEVKI